MSDFAEYVEKQQAKRHLPKPAAAASGAAAPAALKPAAAAAAASAAVSAPRDDTLDDLDDILDALDFEDAPMRVPMRQLLAVDDAGDGAHDGDDDSLAALAALLTERIHEGSGEAVFDLGFEHNGDSLGLTRDQWDRAQRRLTRAADRAGADCQLLLTRNVGGPLDVAHDGAAGSNGGGGGTANADKRRTDCTGKVMVRRRPQTVDDVIETRIAVVGNGMFFRRRPCFALFALFDRDPFPPPPPQCSGCPPDGRRVWVEKRYRSGVCEYYYINCIDHDDTI